MASTPNIGITLVEQSQSQKEITINEAFARIDALLNNGAVDINNTPPSSPVQGELHIVGTAPTGAWAGQANAIVYYDQIWRFIPPHAGVQLWVNSASQFYLFNGTAWVAAGGGSGAFATLQTFSAGINVGNTAIATPTTLDWYEEGTFTPVLYGVTTAGTGTYTVQSGMYRRIGNRVEFSLLCVWTAHTGTGEGRITGLPYTNAHWASPCSVLNQGYVTTAGAVLIPTLEGGSSYIRLIDQATGTGGNNAPNITTAATLFINGGYFV